MINIIRGAANTLTLTLSELVTIPDPKFIFRFTESTFRTSTLQLVDTSQFPTRYNEFTFTEGVDVSLYANGSYEVFQSNVSTNILSGGEKLLESGMYQINKSSTQGAVFDPIINGATVVYEPAISFIGPQGPAGAAGAPGPQGPAGTAGTSVIILGYYDTIEELEAAHPTGNTGDAYVVAGDLYVWNTDHWENVGALQGPQGPQGATGATGPQGAPSTVAGPQGPQGYQGARGYQGATGADSTVQGPQGYTGATGPQGPQGARGADSTVQGPQGPQGYQGSTGAASTVAGPQGATGATGPQGATGAQGPQGASGTGTGSGESVEISVYQPLHGLTVGNAIRMNNTDQYRKAIADNEVNAEVVGVVSEIVDSANFKYVSNGIITQGIPNNPSGTPMFLSATVSGAVTSVEPTDPSTVSKPVMVILEQGSKAIVLNYRGLINTETQSYINATEPATLTNKRITKRSATITSHPNPTINTDNVDIFLITALAENITSFTANLSGTPTEGQVLWIAITGTATRSITWGSKFESSTAALPTTTVGTARLDVGFVWNTVASVWRCVAVA